MSDKFQVGDKVLISSDAIDTPFGGQVGVVASPPIKVDALRALLAGAPRTGTAYAVDVNGQEAGGFFEDELEKVAG